VAYALLLAGIDVLYIHNRTPARAEALAQEFGHLGEIRVLDDEGLAGEAQSVDLIVNSTSVGMLKEGVSFDETPLDRSLLPDRGAVVDLVYRPATTRLLREANEAGLAVLNGLPMLVYQGAEAF